PPSSTGRTGRSARLPPAHPVCPPVAGEQPMDSGDDVRAGRSLTGKTDATAPTRHVETLGLSVALFALLAILGIMLAPPLFEFDGYMYRLNGLAPLDNLNQAHLLWIPI